MLSDINRPLSIPDHEMSWEAPRIPVAAVKTTASVNKLPASRVFSEEKLAEGAKKIERCWRQVLGLKRGSKITNDASFYDMGGDFIGTAQLSLLLAREGLSVGVEKLIECPVFGSQVALLLAV